MYRVASSDDPRIFIRGVQVVREGVSALSFDLASVYPSEHLRSRRAKSVNALLRSVHSSFFGVLYLGLRIVRWFRFGSRVRFVEGFPAGLQVNVTTSEGAVVAFIGINSRIRSPAKVVRVCFQRVRRAIIVVEGVVVASRSM